MAEQLRLDQSRRERGEVQREERAGRRLDEDLPGRVERDVAREPDRPGDQLLAGTRGPGDQGRDVAHPGVEPAAVAPGVVGEDRLPHRRAQPRRRRRGSDDRRIDVMEGPAHLEERREEMRGLAGDGEGSAARADEALEVLQK